MGGGGYNPWLTLRAWVYNLASLIGETYPLVLNESAKEFLRNMDYKENPQNYWINSIEDRPNIF